MPTIEEMTAWSPRDIQVELKKLLPEGWVFEHIVSRDGFFRALVVDVSDQKKPLVQWEGDNLDERLLLFDAYGWLWMKKHPPEKRQRTPWKTRKSELTRKAVTQRVTLGKDPAPDPEDLDPNEVASIYKERQ